jgi:TetR/AcrR family transcriptional repressor of nem operon
MSTELSPKAAEIAAHARLLLAAGGYNGFSYADISERVHISKASIHHHFPSKAELVRTVVAMYREEARVGLATLDGQVEDPVARINAYLSYWSACIVEGTAAFCICAMLAAELPSIPEEVAQEVRGHFQDLTAWLAAVFKKGSASGRLHLQGSAKADAQGFMATVHGAMLAARALGRPELFLEITKPAVYRLAAG